MGAGIAAVGSYVPDKVLTNYDLEKMVETSDEWIVSRTGIRERRIAAHDETTSDLAVKATKKALESGNMSVEEIDLIIISTITGDMAFPSTACFVQQKLGIKDIPCMDISAACTGFIYALDIAAKYINSLEYRTVLVIGAEVISRVIDWKDRNTCVLFGDGAGAVIVKNIENGRGIIKTVLGANGAYADLLNMPGGGSKHPTSHETISEGLHYLKMKGNDIYKLAIRLMESACRDLFNKTGCKVEDIDLFIPHQANLRIIHALCEKLEIPPEKVYTNLETRGNVSAASAIIALDDAYREGRVRPGDMIVFVAFGGGLTWGASLVRW